MKEETLKEIVNNMTKLVQYKTICNNYNEFDEAIEFIKEELREYNVEEYIVNNYKNIVVTNTESRDLDVLFCCHLDVVPCDKYEVKIDGTRAYGRGVFDMKGQLAVVMSVLKNTKSEKKIGLMVTSDEEIGGQCCKEILNNYNAKVAIVPDGGKNFELIIEEKGLLQMELICKGKTSHASEPYKGVNPIIELMNLYNNLINIYPLPKDENEYVTSINLSKLNGGDANNMVPSVASMTLDIRYTKEDNPDTIIDSVKKMCNNTDVNVLVNDPMFYVDKDLDVVKDFILNAEEVLGKKLEIKKCVATSDAIYFSAKGIPTILINPIGDYWHGPNEYVEMDSLYILYEIFKKMI